MKKLYPSSVAPVSGYTTNSYKESCPRFFAMTQEIEFDRGEIHPLYQAIGRIAEERVKGKLEESLGPRYELLVETSVRHQLAPGWVLSGRMDFFVRDRMDATNNRVWEVKCTVSKGKFYNVIQKGQPDPKQLGQLLTYMIITNTVQGTLSCHYAHFNKQWDLQFKTRDFDVLIQNEQIFVDGVLWDKHSISDFVRFYPLMIDAVDKPDLPARTMNARACETCVFNATCDKNPKTKQEFIEIYKEVGDGEIKVFPDPVIRQYTQRSKK